MNNNHIFSVEKDGKLFRYLNLGKFNSLIERSALYFSRMDKMSDSREGSLFGSGGANKTTYGMCWRFGDYGDHANLFKEYKAEDGCIIETTIKHLRNAFRIFPIDFRSIAPPLIEFPYVIFARVQYIDRGIQNIEIDQKDTEIFCAQFTHNLHTHLYPYLLKNIDRRFENEVRIFTQWQTVTLNQPTYLSEGAIFELCDGHLTEPLPCTNLEEIYALENLILGRSFGSSDDIDKMQPVGFFYHVDLSIINKIHIISKNRNAIQEKLEESDYAYLVERLIELD